MNVAMRQIVALHGQLGVASDWDRFAHLAKEKGFAFESLDLWSSLKHQGVGMAEFGKQLNKRYLNVDAADEHVLLGYSMGGRLALHALVEDSSKWSAIVIVSAHLGLDSEKGKLTRREVDDTWSQKAMTLPWDEFLTEWNRQPVLSNGADKLVDRNELESRREEISRSFKCWSLAEQEYLLSKLRDIKVPVLFVVGESDKKFYEHITDMMQHLKQPNMSMVSISRAGHRVPWEAEGAFSDKVFDWLSEVR